MGMRNGPARNGWGNMGMCDHKITVGLRLLNCGAALLLIGCATGNPVSGGGGAGGNRSENQNNNSPPSDQNTRTLAAISFSPGEGFPQGRDPATFEIGGGSVTTSGGRAGSLGQSGLYADDSFAWDLFGGARGSITFDGLEVVDVDGYWVHPITQTNGAIMTANFSGGGTRRVDSFPVNANGGFGQPGGFFQTVSAPEGETIVELSFEFRGPAALDDVAALDVLELTVRTGP